MLAPPPQPCLPAPGRTPEPLRGSSPLFRLVLVALAAFAPSCASSRDLVELSGSTSWRSTAPPLPRMLVRLEGDTRPREERGIRKFLGENYVGGNALREPSDVSALRVLARDLVSSGVTEDAGFVADGQSLVLGVVIVRLGGAYREGVENIVVPVLPTTPVEGRCTLRLRLRDDEGRLFLDEEFTGEDERSGAFLAGVEGEAARSLAASIRRCVDTALPRVRASVDEFRAARGMQ